jgi:hypothetical protein
VVGNLQWKQAQVIRQGEEERQHNTCILCSPACETGMLTPWRPVHQSRGTGQKTTAGYLPWPEMVLESPTLQMYAGGVAP